MENTNITLSYQELYQFTISWNQTETVSKAYTIVGFGETNIRKTFLPA